MAMRVVEVVRRVAECIHFQLAQEILGELLQDPVHHQAAFDAALGMHEEDNFGDPRIVKLLFQDPVANPGVTSGVIEVALYEAFDDVEDNPVCLVVNSDDGTAEGESQAVDGTLEPVLAVRKT